MPAQDSRVPQQLACSVLNRYLRGEFNVNVGGKCPSPSDVTRC